MRMRANINLRFSLDEYRRRFVAVTEELSSRGIDALLIRIPEHICYLTGYEDPHIVMYHCLVVTERGPVLLARRYELENIEEYTWLHDWVTIEDHEHPAEAVAACLERESLQNGRIGYERGLRKAGMFLGVEEYETLRSKLPNARFIPAGDLIASIRVTKSEAEIAALRRAAQIADHAVGRAIEIIEPGRTENDVAAAYFHAAITGGSEYPSLTPFFLSGPRTSLPHGTWRGRKIEAGDPFLFEASANWHRYEAPVMRTVSVGEPSDLVRRLADAELRALDEAFRCLRPGLTGAQAHKIIYDVMDAEGFGGEHYKHPSGYSIGLSLPPAWSETHYMTLSPHERKPLGPNMTFHVVPISLIYRTVGVGFSAVVRVTEDGCEALTEPRSFDVLPG